ncbi:energy transducer TonB [Sphingomonas fuzhouensis]|uniref:energy transducer TonB n=1 Tax=Sphingomonas fuzhouensis TaxID=3106033 RepID=UPI002AFDEFC3|nr:energy transducer TonB [Sphingomonas sp. SGZ-02]
MILILALLALQETTAPLEAASPWQVAPSSEGCIAQRAFKGEDAVQIGFEETLHSRTPYLLIRAPNALLPSGIGQINVSVDNAPPIAIHYGAFATQDTRYRLLKLFPDKAALASLHDATTIRLEGKMPPLHVTSIGAVLQKMDECMSSKLADWGVSPSLYFEDKLAKVSKQLLLAFDNKRYPEEARRAGVSGRVLLLLKTDPTGAITDCKAVESADERLNTGSCAIAKEARLIPPTDASGRPMASYAFLPIRWNRP